MFAYKANISRLKKLEGYAPKPLVIFARLPDGSETTCTVDECITSGWEFLRVKHGSNLRDLDKLLKQMFEDAKEDVKEAAEHELTNEIDAY